MAVALAAGAGLSGIAACGGSQEPAASAVFVSGNEDQLYSEGLRARRAGDLERAEQAFLEATQANPRYIAAWIALGSLHRSTGRHEDARDAYARAVSIQERNVDAQLGLAQAEAELQNIEAANRAAGRAAELAQASRLSDVEGEALRVLAAMQILTGDSEGAIGSLERTLQLDSTNVQARVTLAELYDAQGRRNDAVRLLSMAASTMNDVEGLLHIGRTFHSFGMMDRSAEVLGRAYEIDPDHDTVGFLLASANLDLGNRDLAVSLASRVISRNPDYLDAYVVRGQGTMRRVDTARARTEAGAIREALNRARPDAEFVLSRDPEHYGALVLLGQIQHGLGETDEALATWQTALTSAPGRRTAAALATEAELARGNHEAVVAILEPRIEHFSRDLELRERLGRSLIESGRYADGAATLTTVAEERRTDAELHHLVARTALDHPGTVSSEQALAHAQEAIAHGGNMRIAYRVALIDALRANGRASEALRYATDSLRDFPENPQLLDRIEEMR